MTWTPASNPPAAGQHELTLATDLAVRTALRDAIGQGLELDRVVFILTRCAAETRVPFAVLVGHCIAAVDRLEKRGATTEWDELHKTDSPEGLRIT